MAYRRIITARAKLFNREQKLSPLFSHMNHQNDDDVKKPSKIPVTESPKLLDFLQNRSYNNFICSRYSYKGYNQQLFSVSPTQQLMHSMNLGSNFSRNMSTGAGEGSEVVNTVEYLGDSAADVFKDMASTAAEAVAATQVDPLMSEAAVAAAGSFFPVAALQYLIDYVHIFTGLNWWGAIVVTTLLIRLATSPLVINQMKATSKFTLIRPQIEAIREEMQNMDMSSEAVAEGQQRIKNIFKEYGVSPFTPLKGLLVQGPVFVCFYLAISNMVEKVPSFKEGGAFWFTDLTTPDSMYILPVLTALTFWITVECNMQEGMEGNPAAGVIKNVSRGFAVLTIPLTASFAKGIFCYWITSNIFSLLFGTVIKQQSIKKALGIPIIAVTPPTPGNQKPSFSFFQAIKKYAEAQAQAQKQQILSSSSAASEQAETQKPQVLSSPAEASKSASKAAPSSSSLINQKIKSLEREVKGRKKAKNVR